MFLYVYFTPCQVYLPMILWSLFLVRFLSLSPRSFVSYVQICFAFIFLTYLIALMLYVAQWGGLLWHVRLFLLLPLPLHPRAFQAQSFIHSFVLETSELCKTQRRRSHALVLKYKLHTYCTVDASVCLSLSVVLQCRIQSNSVALIQQLWC